MIYIVTQILSGYAPIYIWNLQIRKDIIMETAFVLLTIELGFEEDTLKVLKGIPEVKEALGVYGVYDIILRVEADTREDLKEVIGEIRHMEKVRSTLTMIVV